MCTPEGDVFREILQVYRDRVVVVVVLPFVIRVDLIGMYYDTGRMQQRLNISRDKVCFGAGWDNEVTLYCWRCKSLLTPCGGSKQAHAPTKLLIGFVEEISKK